MAVVFWFTGLSGAGKSTLAGSFYKDLKTIHPALYLDGDELREAFGAANSYTFEERRHLAFQYARLCALVVKQGIHVVCATVSMFEEVRAWNRKVIPQYFEIYLKVPMKVLMERKASLYASSQKGPIVGLDLPFEEPQNPDIILNNDGSITPTEHIDYLKEKFYGAFSNQISNSTPPK